MELLEKRLPDTGVSRDIRRAVLVVAAAFLMALNIKTFVRTGGLFPGGATGLTLLIQRLADKYLGLAIPYTPVNAALNAFPSYLGCVSGIFRIDNLLSVSLAVYAFGNKGRDGILAARTRNGVYYEVYLFQFSIPSVETSLLFSNLASILRKVSGFYPIA